MQSTCTTTRGSGLRGFLARYWPRRPHGCNPRHRAPCAWASSQALVWRLTSVMPVWTSRRQRPPVSHQTQHTARGCVSHLAREGGSALPDAGGNGAFSLPHRWTAINLCAVPSPMHALACELHREVMRLVACEWPLRHGGPKWLCSSASRCVGRCELSRAGELLLRTAARERASPAPRLLNFPRARTRRIQAARHNLGLDLGKFDRR